MLYEISTLQFATMLKNLLGFIEKASAQADAKKYDVQVLLQSRLAPDQYPFIRQVQITCDTAKGLAARLAGVEPPKHEDNEQTVAQVRARIQKTIEYLATFKADQFKGAESRVIGLPFMPGKGMDGRDYAVQMAIPNFYFHLSTAYAILRHNGVDLGKTDFIGRLDTKDI